jgi:hypothetical protein
MSVVLLVVGILITGVGLVAVGFGIPINELVLGYTLITAGTTAACGGLLLIGVALAVGQLTRIAEALRRPQARPAARPSETPPRTERPEPTGARAEPVPARYEPPPRGARPPEPRPLVETRGPEPRPTPVPEPRPVGDPRPLVEPRPAAETRPPALPEPPRQPVEASRPAEPALDVSASAIERLRSALPRPDRVAAERVVTDGEEVPLSPNGPTHAPAEPKPAEPPAAEAREPRLDFLFRSRPAKAAQPEQVEPFWPKRPGVQPRVEDTSKPQAQPAPEAVVMAEPRPAPAAPPAVAPAPVAAAPAVMEERHAEPPPRSPPEEARATAVLKSGVVDGMAYTLYADGSIVAQLPQGTVRFGSIAELRAHIETNS